MEELRRSTQQPIIAGVAAGLGDYFKTNPLLFRILFILTGLYSGIGVLIYVVLWIGLSTDQDQPQEIEPEQSPSPGKTGSSRSSTLATGLLLIVLGLLFLLEEFIPAFYFEKFWPILLVITGIVLLYNSTRSHKAPSTDHPQAGQSSTDSIS